MATSGPGAKFTKTVFKVDDHERGIISQTFKDVHEEYLPHHG